MNELPVLKIGDLTVDLPIIQGGMGVGISGVSLAAAVANEGGVGVLSSAGMGFDSPGYRADPVGVGIRALKDDIHTVRQLTDGVVGVNIMVATSNFAEMAGTAIDMGIDIIFAGAGLPMDLPKHLTESSKTKLVPIVSSARAATLILRKWKSAYNYTPDAFVVEGPLAGGHLGFKKNQIHEKEYALHELIPQVVEAVGPFEQEIGRTIPVIAAGGIYYGGDIHEFLELGAAGVQMGTRFVTTTECDASDEFKNSYLQCNEEDIIIIDSPVGLPGRAIRNSFLDAVGRGDVPAINCPYLCIKSCDENKRPYCIALALLNAKKGNMERGFAFAGQHAYRANTIVSVHELIEDIKTEYSESVFCYGVFPLAKRA